MKSNTPFAEGSPAIQMFNQVKTALKRTVTWTLAIPL